MKKILIIFRQLILWCVERGCIAVSDRVKVTHVEMGKKINHSCCSSILVPIWLSFKRASISFTYIFIWLPAPTISTHVYVAHSSEFSLCECRANACRRDNLPATVPHWCDCSVNWQMRNVALNAKRSLSLERTYLFFIWKSRWVSGFSRARLSDLRTS